MDWFDGILSPIMWVVAWIMVLAHRLFEAMGMASTGLSWILSIVALVVVIRIILIPLFVKQIKASRGMQIVQPQIQALQKKYKGKTDPASRQAQQEEMMAIYREAGTNPFASCLPILAQSPIFFALFRVLYRLPLIASGEVAPIGPLGPELAAEAERSQLFGAPLSAWFMMPADQVPADTTLLTIRVVTAVLIVAMSATTFLTQRQLTMKNMPAAALDNPMARQQKMMMYLFPLIFMITGVNFPIGVLIYWTTTNLWSMGQQFYVIRNMPAPGSEAEKKYLERKARKEARRARRSGVLGGGVATLEDAAPEAAVEEAPVSRQRQQPTGKKRAKKKGLPKASGAAGAGAGSGSGEVGSDGSAPEGERATEGSSGLLPVAEAQDAAVGDGSDFGSPPPEEDAATGGGTKSGAGAKPKRKRRRR